MRDEDVELLKNLQAEQDPELLIGSPPCRSASIMRYLSRAKRDPWNDSHSEADGAQVDASGVDVWRKSVVPSSEDGAEA